MKSISFNQAKAKGFSLIELLLVLGVLAILLVAAFVVYPQVRDRNQANAEVSNLTALKANITNLYASRGGNYDGLNTGVANQARAFPSSMNGGRYGASIQPAAAWGGNVTVAVNAAPTTTTQTPSGVLSANRSFSITYAGVPDGVCLGLVSGAASNFQGVRVGTIEVMDANGFNPGIAAGACTGNPTVVFTSN
jgi:prepilin-type N-terminal cleavage/methylation domain-containing protein